MADDPSVGAGATPPTPTPPATGIPAGAGATPPPASLTLEEALKRIADLEHSQRNSTEEVERHRKKLTAYEKAEAEREAAKKAAEEAQLSEIERTKKQQTDTQGQLNTVLAELQEERVYSAVARYAGKLNFILSPERVAQLLSWSEIEYEHGKPTNIERLLEKLAKAEPDLIRKTAEPGPPVQQQPTQPVAPALPAMNQGRTQINPPGTREPGKVPSMADAYAWSKQQRGGRG